MEKRGMTERQNAAIQRFFQRLLRGEGSNLEGQLARYAPMLAAEDYMVWLLKITEQESVEAYLELFRVLGQYSSPEFRYQLVLAEQGLVVIFGLMHFEPDDSKGENYIGNRPDFLQRLEWFAGELTEEAHRTCGVQIRSYASRPKAGVLGICQGYREVEQMCICSSFLGLEAPMIGYRKFEELAETFPPHRAVAYMLTTFSGQMAKEKYAQAEEGLQRFMDACFVTSAPLPEDMKQLLQVVAGTVLTAYYTAAKRPDPTQLEQLTKVVSDPFRCGTLERLRELLVAPIHSLRQEEFAPAEGDWLQTVRFYIAGHLDRPELTLTEVAGQVHLSPAYVSRTFKQQCGLGLTDYIQELRVEKAEQLLGTGKSLSEIASDCGFSSLRTMRNVFMKHKGKTPSACRRD